MTRLLIATTDRHVYDEIAQLLGDGIESVSPADAGVTIPEGSGATFEQDAMGVASAAAQAGGMVALAESAGIVVDVLNGEPGVSSSTYAGANATEVENRRELLRDVDDAGATSRSARMVSAIAVAHPDGRLQAFESTLEGVITREERGVEGAGYEPIFELDDGMTIAELLPDARDRVHPRYVALAEARPFIDELLSGQDD